MRPIRRAALAVVVLVGLLVANQALRAGGAAGPIVFTGLAVALLCALLIAWAGRASRRQWIEELRAALRGTPAPHDATALIADVRRHVETLTDGVQAGATTQPWTARRLRRPL